MSDILCLIYEIDLCLGDAPPIDNPIINVNNEESSLTCLYYRHRWIAMFRVSYRVLVLLNQRQPESAIV